MTTLKFSSNPDSYVNRARQLLHDGKQEFRRANKGTGCRSRAARMMNTARTQLRQVLYGAKPAHYRHADFTTTIAGIPCGIAIDHYTPERINNRGHPDNREPDDPAEVEFTVLDRKGYPAKWLEARADMGDLTVEVLEWCRENV